MRANLQGLEIDYDVQGQGIPLLLMHAFPLDRRLFGPLRGARLITFDAPGAGKSSLPPEGFGMDDLAAVAIHLLDHVGIAQAVVGGVSMGGYAAFAFARQYPERLRGLVLSNTRVVADTEEGKRSRAEMADAARRQGAAEIARRMLPRLLGATTQQQNPALVRQVQGWIEEQPPEGIARLLGALAARQDASDLLPRIAVPTLVIAGVEDSIATPSEAGEWAARISGARFVTIEGAGHLPVLEQPAVFAGVVEDFLKKLSAP
jgi:pimeloyl-ACP methyl ester carboxylesterase